MARCSDDEYGDGFSLVLLVTWGLMVNDKLDRGRMYYGMFVANLWDVREWWSDERKSSSDHWQCSNLLCLDR